MSVRTKIRALAIATIAFAPIQANAEEAIFQGATTIGDETLGKTTGREDVLQFADSTQNSTVSGNSVNGNSVTGNLALDGNAFQNLSGLAIINANTGNNVSINASMQVNISITAAP